MSQSKRELIKATLIAGLVSANKSNPFWSRSDAMISLNIFRGNK
jgi:hypothetical protein